jgi:hypothetical protein
MEDEEWEYHPRNTRYGRKTRTSQEKDLAKAGKSDHHKIMKDFGRKTRTSW